ncbi:MAG: hypothetical protein LBU32_08450 [Clostridiales bacterium]|nr:hypothetical protein [Clostridiales bacterium]
MKIGIVALAAKTLFNQAFSGELSKSALAWKAAHKKLCIRHAQSRVGLGSRLICYFPQYSHSRQQSARATVYRPIANSGDIGGQHIHQGDSTNLFGDPGEK